MILGAAILMAVSLAGLLVVDASTGYAALLVQFVVLGAGLGLIVPAMTAALLGSVDRTRSGVASGTLNTARQTGSVIGVALFGSLIGSGGSGGARQRGCPGRRTAGLAAHLRRAGPGRLRAHGVPRRGRGILTGPAERR